MRFIPSVAGIQDTFILGEVILIDPQIPKNSLIGKLFWFQSSTNSLKWALFYLSPKSAQFTKTQISTRFVS